MITKPKYSILIPVYNTSKFLRQCFDSILTQKINDYEVIVVNDGSTDNSLEICEEYANLHSNIFIISQKNKGLLLTRRVAIHKSRGDYLLFLDSDDFWEPNALEIIDKAINDNNFPDIVIFNHNKVDENGEFISKYKPDLPYNSIISRENYNRTIYEYILKGDDLNSLWSKAVVRDIVDFTNNYYNYSNVSLGEDILQSIPLFIKSKNVLFIDSYLYNYRINKSSITNNFGIKSWHSISTVKTALLAELQKQPDFSEYLLAIYYSRNINFFFSIIVSISVSNRPYNDKKKLLLVINEDPITFNSLLFYTKLKNKKHKPGMMFFYILFKHKLIWLMVICIRLAKVFKH